MDLPRNVQRFRDLFLKAGVVDELQMRSALAKREKWGGRLAHIIVQLNFADEETVMKVVSAGLHMPVTHLGKVHRDPSVSHLFDPHECEQSGIFPISLRNQVLQVAMADPTDIRLIEELRTTHGARVQHVLASEGEILAAINRVFRGGSAHRGTVPGGSTAGVGASSHAQRNEPVFELDHTDATPPGSEPAELEGYGSHAPMRAVTSPSGVMARPPSAGTLLDELLDGGDAPAPVVGHFTAEDLQRLATARINQEKTGTILRVLQELLAAKGYLR